MNAYGAVPVKKLFIATFAVSLLVSAAISYDQGDEPAEKVYKNIVSFKGVPAKDLMPAMRFMSASMKADCSYCHNPNDYAADRPNKETTRRMIDLQRDINTRFFEGRLEVTCNSCHNGMEHPPAVPTLEGIKLRHARYRTEKTAADFFKGHLDGVGGAGPVLRFKGTVKEADAPEGPYELVQAADGRFFVSMPGRTMGYDGTTAWVKAGDVVYKLADDDAMNLMRWGRAYRTPAAFEGYERPSISGTETLGEHKTVVVRGNLPAKGVMEEFYFDEASGLLSRTAAFTRSSLGTVPTFFDYADYRAVEGIKVPFKITSLSYSGTLTVIQFQSGTAAADFDVKGFSPPEK